MQHKKKNVGSIAGKTRARGKILPAELVEKNKGLAFKIVFGFWRTRGFRFERMGHGIKDLNQQAVLDMLRAARDWNPKKGKFTTLAGTYVKHGLATILKNESAAKRSETPTSLSLFEDGRTKLFPRVGEKQSINLAERLMEIRKTVERIKRPERDKNMFFEKFGLGGEAPKSSLEIAKKYNISKNAVNAAVHLIQIELVRKLGTE